MMFDDFDATIQCEDFYGEEPETITDETPEMSDETAIYVLCKGFGV